VNPSLFNKLPYDSEKAFAAIGVIGQFPNVLVCTPSFQARTVADVVRLARAKPKDIADASSGNGSAQHLAGALFEQLAQVQLNHVPYRGGGPALTDVMGGQVPLFFANVASSMGRIQSGKLRALAVTTKVRTRVLPDVPTMEESGVKGHEVLEWNPLLAPAAVPAVTKARLTAALNKVKEDPGGGRTRACAGRRHLPRRRRAGHSLPETAAGAVGPRDPAAGHSPGMSSTIDISAEQHLDGAWDCHVHVFDATAPVLPGHYRPTTGH